MNNLTTIAENTINFRTKFTKIFQEYPDGIMQKVTGIFRDFIAEPSNSKCHEFLWLMTYDPSKALKSVGLVFDSPSTPNSPLNASATNDIAISENDVMLLRNELRYQRMLIHKDFLTINVLDNCQKAYQTLEKAAGQIISINVYNNCLEYCRYMNEESISRLLYLLSSKNEKNYFGGIRSLRFGKKAANILKPYVKEILNLYEALWEQEKIKRKSTTRLEQIVHLFESNFDEMSPSNKDNDNAEVSINEKTSLSDNEDKACPSTEEVHVKEISPQNIIDDNQIFKNFIKACYNLQKAGYDCTMVLGKIDAISEFFEAFKKLE